MIDDFFDRFRSNGSDDIETETPEMSISEMSDEAKRDAAFQHRFRCVHCNIPNFRETLYLIEHEDDAAPACESCLQTNGESHAITEDRQVPAAMTGRLSYQIGRVESIESLRHRQHGDVAVKVVDEDGNVHMGEYPRKMVESKYANPKDTVWLGYYKKGNRIRELGMDYEDLFVHVFIQGTTGGGKTTTAFNLFLQFAWSGFGFACIDPHGDLVEDLLAALPPHRREDIVLFDPTGDDDRKASLNLLEIEKEPGDPGYHEAVDAAVADVRSGMRRGGDWGQRMGPICDNLARGMIMHPDTFTFIDFRNILIHEDRRKIFADKIAEEGFFFADYTREIAEMGRIELSPLIRRLNGWTDSKTSRDIISHEESTISFEELIHENKILLFNANLPDDDMQRMLSSAMVRRLARTAKSVPKGERTPFLMVADEVDDIINDEMNLDDLLSNMRKFKFGMVLMTQYLGKIDDPKVEKAIRKLCNTTLTYRDPDGEFAKRSTSASSNLDDYHALVKLGIDGNTKGPYEMLGFPRYPARRTPDEATEWVRKPALERNGVEATEETDSSNPLELTQNRKQTVLQAIYDSELIDGDGRGVRIDDARPRIIERHPNGDDIDHPTEIDAMISEIPSGEDGDIFRYEDAVGDIRLSTTARGRKHIWQTGSNIQSGGVKHTQLLMDAYDPLTELGARVEIPDEQSTGRQPDATIQPDPHAEAHPVIDRLTNGSQAVVEAESATGRTKPGKTCQNVQKAVENGQRCLLLCRPDDAEKIWNTIHDPPFQSSQTIDGQHRLYNVRNLVIDGEVMLRPSDASETVWIEEPDGPGFAFRDSNGNEFHRFGNGKAVMEDAGAYPHSLPTGSEIPEQWTRVKAPFIPDGLDSDLVDIITIPRDADSPSDLGAYEGEHVPLTELHQWEETNKKDEIADELREILDE